MGKFIVGILIGIVVATVGINGIASVIDRGIVEVQNLSKQLIH